MDIIDLIYPKNRIVSIVGTCKNAGKTATLNEIISQCGEKDIPIALISTGRDGERRDVLTETKKPPIFVKKGTIISTVENAIKPQYAGIEIYSVTNYSTPMGRVVIGRTAEDGYVEISGPYSSRTIRSMCEEMLSFGAKLALIDGSLDRRSSAAPFVSDGTVLATGAALARTQDLVIDKTMHIIRTYSIPPIDKEEIRDIAECIMEEGKTAIIKKDLSITYVETLTSLRSGSLIAEALGEDSQYVVLPGSATTETIKDIVQNAKSNITIIIKDGTKVFIPPREFNVLKKMGLNINVLNPINIIAVTVNPCSPEGYYFDPPTFLEKMKNAVPDIPVFDVMQRGGSCDY